MKFIESINRYMDSHGGKYAGYLGWGRGLGCDEEGGGVVYAKAYMRLCRLGLLICVTLI